MTLKTETNGTIALINDGSTNYTYKLDTGTSVYDTVNEIVTSNYVNTAIANATKKLEVRPEQRSALEIKGRVVAKFYKDGFFTNSKDLIPAIKSVEVFNENTVKVTFVNGNVQKSTAQKGDTFSLEDGVLRCIVKEMIGKEGTAVLGKLLSYATDVYNKAEEDKKKKTEEEFYANIKEQSELLRSILEQVKK
jgi:hypothetical protein